jgi:nucleotide-binding universal stress UspA family protein
MSIIETIDVQGGILVGHDGSATATAALLAAVRCAPVFGPDVHVVRAWTLATAEAPVGHAAGYLPSYEDFEAATLEALEEDVAPVRADHRNVSVSCSVVHGNAAEKLIEASDRVRMVVLGGRGHGGFAGLMLGSVSEKVIRHARCRVLVERGPRTSQTSADELERERLESALASELKLS